MKITSKIHTFIEFFRYAVVSKSKFKVHSPFVFNFILEILERKNIQASLQVKELKNYYKGLGSKIRADENAGAGSKVLDLRQTKLLDFIHLVGISNSFGNVLANLAERTKNSTILELGSSLGISTRFLSTEKSNKVISIEANKTVLNLATRAYKELGIENVSFINGFFDEVLEDVLSKNKNISLVFIDGDHQKEATLRYFNKILPCLSSGAVIVLDDINWSEEMSGAWLEIKQKPEVSLSIDLFRMGIVFLRKEQKEKEDFILWY